MKLEEALSFGVQLRLQLRAPGVEAALVAYERQCRGMVEPKEVGDNVFITLYDDRQSPTPMGRHWFVPDQFRTVRFEWLVVSREAVVLFDPPYGQPQSKGTVVLVVHSGGQPLRPFDRQRGEARFSGRSLSVVRLTSVPTQRRDQGRCEVSLQDLTLALRPKFRMTREEREERDMPRESPWGFEPKVEYGTESVRLMLDLTKVGTPEVVIPTSQGGFKPTIGWPELSPAQQAAVLKLVCGHYGEDYALDVHQRRGRVHHRFGSRDGEMEWVVPADHAGWYEANRDKPLWQQAPKPKEQKLPGVLGLDGFPVRQPKDCVHLHFAQGVDPSHEEPEEDGYARGYDDGRW